MSILWLIIKIILIIVLSILGLGVVILGIILLSPIRYEAYWAKYENLSYDIKVTYLMGIKGIFYLDEEKKNHKISLFGRVLYKNEAEEVEPPIQVGIEEKKSDARQENKSKVNLKKEEMLKKRSSHRPIMSKTENVKQEKKVNPHLKQATEMSVEEVSGKVKDETIETVKEMPSFWAKKLIFDKQTYWAIRQICKCIWRIIKTVWPYEWDFEVVIGEEDPADTGELIAKLTMLYPLYYKHGIVKGEYERACLEGGFLVKGKFTIGRILLIILQCALSQSVRSLIKFIIELRKEEHNGK